MKLKQKFCSHDYVTVENMTVLKAAEQYVFDNGEFTQARNLVYASPYASNRVLHDKVCLKCGHCVTDLSDYRKKLANMTPEEISKLEDDVRRMFLESAKQARRSRDRLFKARVILKEHLDGQKDK